MTCKICRRKIGKNDPRSYAHVKAAPGRKPRKVYACAPCQGAFDNWLDSRALDTDGTPLETAKNPAGCI
jgi:hypothetical protein